MFITDRQLLRLQVVTDMFNNIEYTIRHKQVEQGRFRTVFPSERNCMFISIVTRVPSQPGHVLKNSVNACCRIPEIMFLCNECFS